MIIRNEVDIINFSEKNNKIQFLKYAWGNESDEFDLDGWSCQDYPQQI